MHEKMAICETDGISGHGRLTKSARKQLLRRMAAQKTDNEIAIQLGGTAEKIAQQRIRLLSKLQISSKTEIAEAVERLRWPMSVKGTQSQILADSTSRPLRH